MRKLTLWTACVLSAGFFTGFAASAEPVTVPVLAPITGFLALEGGAQRNGALLAADHAGDGLIKADVQDTTTAPAVAVSVFPTRAPGWAATCDVGTDPWLTNAGTVAAGGC